MDFATVRNKLRNGLYQTMEQFEVRAMWPSRALPFIVFLLVAFYIYVVILIYSVFGVVWGVGFLMKGGGINI